MLMVGNLFLSISRAVTSTLKHLNSIKCVPEASSLRNKHADVSTSRAGRTSTTMSHAVMLRASEKNQ